MVVIVVAVMLRFLGFPLLYVLFFLFFIVFNFFSPSFLHFILFATVVKKSITIKKKPGSRLKTKQ